MYPISSKAAHISPHGAPHTFSNKTIAGFAVVTHRIIPSKVRPDCPPSLNLFLLWFNALKSTHDVPATRTSTPSVGTPLRTPHASSAMLSPSWHASLNNTPGEKLRNMKACLKGSISHEKTWSTRNPSFSSAIIGASDPLQMVATRRQRRPDRNDSA